jgi:hypothetical protein
VIEGNASLFHPQQLTISRTFSRDCRHIAHDADGGGTGSFIVASVEMSIPTPEHDLN